MKAIFNSMLFILSGALLFLSSCDKMDSLPYYPAAKDVVLTTTTATIAPAPSDSNNLALKLSWNNDNYPIETSAIKYIVQFDSAGMGFHNAVQKEIIGMNDTGFLAKELNDYALGRQWEFGKVYHMEARVISSYENNNDQRISNVVAFTYTPYKVPPKVALPASGHLYLVGDASQGGWTNPAPVPAQEFSQLDETTFAGVSLLNGDKQFLVLPQNDGVWDNKFAVPDNSVAGIDQGGDFGSGAGFDQNFKGPAADGWYKITLDFQHGKFTITPWEGHIPETLMITGSATPSDWSNPVPANQEFTRLNSSEYELTVTLHGGKEYLMLPVNNGVWDHKYAVADASVPGLAMGGAFGYDFGQNIPGPTADGTYKINVNFAKGVQGMFSLTKQ